MALSLELACIFSVLGLQCSWFWAFELELLSGLYMAESRLLGLKPCRPISIMNQSIHV